MTTVHALIMVFGAVMPATWPRQLDDPRSRCAGHGAAGA